MAVYLQAVFIMDGENEMLNQHYDQLTCNLKQKCKILFRKDKDSCIILRELFKSLAIVEWLWPSPDLSQGVPRALSITLGDQSSFPCQPKFM